MAKIKCESHAYGRVARISMDVDPEKLVKAIMEDAEQTVSKYPEDMRETIFIDISTRAVGVLTMFLGPKMVKRAMETATKGVPELAA